MSLSKFLSFCVSTKSGCPRLCKSSTIPSPYLENHQSATTCFQIQNMKVFLPVPHNTLATEVPDFICKEGESGILCKLDLEKTNDHVNLTSL